MSVEPITAALNKALAEAQAEFPSIPRSRAVEVKTKSGDRYSYSYAPLEAILAAVRPALAKHGLAIVQMVEEYEPAGLRLRTELRHEGGDAIVTSRPLVGKFETPQQLGSAETYAKRYALTGILAIATEDDDDGAGASAAPSRAGDFWTSEQRKAIFAVLDELKAEFPPPEGDDDWKATARRTAKRLWNVDSLGALSRQQAGELLKLIVKRRDDLRALPDNDWPGEREDPSEARTEFVPPPGALGSAEP